MRARRASRSHIEPSLGRASGSAPFRGLGVLYCVLWCASMASARPGAKAKTRIEQGMNALCNASRKIQAH
eukprot:7355217-Alexandrium_andersonii.AAC.1